MLAVNDDTLEISSAVSNAAAVSSLTRVRHDTAVRIPVQFHRSGRVIERAAGSTGLIGLKIEHDFSGDYLASASGWVQEGSGQDSVYIFTLNLNTAEIEAQFAPEAEGDPQILSIGLVLELTWWEHGEEFTAVDTVEFVVRNDYNQGGEAPVVPGSPFPGPENILTKTGNLAGLTDVATARNNLGLANMLCRQSVAVPANFAAAGAEGQYAFDAATSRLWIYIGGQWRFQNLFSE